MIETNGYKWESRIEFDHILHVQQVRLFLNPLDAILDHSIFILALLQRCNNMTIHVREMNTGGIQHICQRMIF
ncbi:MAG: hypothetical protein OHK0046_47660 [Anaerolineae bacterium]